LYPCVSCNMGKKCFYNYSFSFFVHLIMPIIKIQFFEKKNNKIQLIDANNNPLAQYYLWKAFWCCIDLIATINKFFSNIKKAFFFIGCAAFQFILTREIKVKGNADDKIIIKEKIIIIIAQIGKEKLK